MTRPASLTGQGGVVDRETDAIPVSRRMCGCTERNLLDGEKVCILCSPKVARHVMTPEQISRIKAAALSSGAPDV